MFQNYLITALRNFSRHKLYSFINIAGLAVGYWTDLEQVAANWEVDRTFVPAMGRDEVAHRVARWNQALSRARDWEEHPPVHLEDITVSRRAFLGGSAG